MTRYSDNIYSGFVAPTSAACSKSYVQLGKTFNFTALAGTGVTLTGTLPPGTQNLYATLFITQQGSANTSNKITVSAGGTNLLTFDQFGSATGFLPGLSVASVGRLTIVASACAIVAAPATGQTNGGEIPISVTYLKDAGDPSCTCQLSLMYNRVDGSFPAPGVAPDGGV